MINNAFLFLSGQLNHQIISEFKRIKKCSNETSDAIILFDETRGTPNVLRSFNYYSFNFNILKNLSFPLYNYKHLVPGNTYLPLFYFYINNKEYDYYWIIEDDVRFSGKWSYFFNTLSCYDEDFLSTHIKKYEDQPLWPRWGMNNPSKSIPLHKRLRSFNPVYRISNEALKFLIYEIKTGWLGHYEVTFTSLLSNYNYSIIDIGGCGKFTPSKLKNLLYYSDNRRLNTIDYGTYRYRPPHYFYGMKKNKLYHPVKPLSHLFLRLKKKLAKQ